jgi:hypothetical protein
MGGLNSEEESY